MGDFDEVELLQTGIRGWLLRSARSGRHELHGISAPDMVALLCAAAFGSALADDPAPAVAGLAALAGENPDAIRARLAG